MRLICAAIMGYPEVGIMPGGDAGKARVPG
jgi:hypothetical protein